MRVWVYHPFLLAVIDCGFVKLKALSSKTNLGRLMVYYFNPSLPPSPLHTHTHHYFTHIAHTESLVVVPISQSSARQRSGRAGRVRSGRVYRLYTEESYDKLQVSTVPEIQRSHLSPLVLQLKALGVDNVLRFHFLSVSPSVSAWVWMWGGCV